MPVPVSKERRHRGWTWKRRRLEMRIRTLSTMFTYLLTYVDLLVLQPNTPKKVHTHKPEKHNEYRIYTADEIFEQEQNKKTKQKQKRQKKSLYGKPTTEFPECLKWLTSTQFLANSSQTEFLFYPVTRPSEDGDYQLDMFPMRYVIRRLASFANQHFELEQLRLWPGPLAESGYYYDQDTGSIACYYYRHPPGTHRSTCHWSRCNVPIGSTTTAPIQREDLLLMMGVSPKKTPTIHRN